MRENQTPRNLNPHRGTARIPAGLQSRTRSGAAGMPTARTGVAAAAGRSAACRTGRARRPAPAGGGRRRPARSGAGAVPRLVEPEPQPRQQPVRAPRRDRRLERRRARRAVDLGGRPRRQHHPGHAARRRRGDVPALARDPLRPRRGDRGRAVVVAPRRGVARGEPGAGPDVRGRQRLRLPRQRPLRAGRRHRGRRRVVRRRGRAARREQRAATEVPRRLPADPRPVQIGYRITTPPAFHDGTLYVAAALSEGHIPGGLVIATDAETGAIRWVFNTIPQGPQTRAGRSRATPGATARGPAAASGPSPPSTPTSAWSTSTPATPLPTTTGRRESGSTCSPTPPSPSTSRPAPCAGTTRPCTTTSGTGTT